MAHKHLTTLVMSWFKNNQKFNEEWSLPGQQVTSKYSYFINVRLGADIPRNYFTSTQSNFTAKNPLLFFQVFQKEIKSLTKSSHGHRFLSRT